MAASAVLFSGSTLVAGQHPANAGLTDRKAKAKAKGKPNANANANANAAADATAATANATSPKGTAKIAASPKGAASNGAAHGTAAKAATLGSSSNGSGSGSGSDSGSGSGAAVPGASPPATPGLGSSGFGRPPPSLEGLTGYDTREALEAEVERLRRELHETAEDKRRSEQILSSLAAQNWDFLMTRAQTMRRQFLKEMDTLIEDVTTLCDNTNKQKLLSLQPASGAGAGAGAAAGAGGAHAVANTSGGDAHPKRNLADKAFLWRESQLSVLLRQPNFRTIYHIFVSVFILFTAKVLLNEYLETDERFISLPLLRWNFSGFFERVVPMWLCMFAAHCVTVPLMWAWRRGVISRGVYTGVYALLLTGFVIGFGYVIQRMSLPVANGFVLLCEQTRMGMKMHAFYRESIRISQVAAAGAPGVDPNDALAVANSKLIDRFTDQMRAFVLFHFCPTLIYRNAYPRSRKIRWSAALFSLGEVCGCIFYTYVIFASFCVPEFQKTAQNLGEVKSLVLSIFNSMLPSIVVYLLAFFGVLHCWMNCWAELMRFADRQFYQDWWNATSYLVYYRKWNLLVGDWLFNYVYSDAQKDGRSRTASLLLTFLVSAVVHEYIISLALGFFYPVMFVLFLGAGVFFIYLTDLKRGNPLWNIFFWTTLIIGNGMLMVLYSREWYARHHPAEFNTDSWLPWSWQPFQQSFQRAVHIPAATAAAAGNA